jgi:2-dehydro-3-deoxyphosphooctonate aldolase (KDO 8-P synthase)
MITIENIKLGDKSPLVLIAGPCVVENEKMIYETAEKIIQYTREADIRFIFKSSYRKANRTSSDSFQGIGDKEALQILADVKKTFGIPVITDIHSAKEADTAAEYVDILQIPAFLCRQTEILTAAGRTGKVVNIKKGQFLAPEDMKKAAEKVESTGNKRILLTERGSTFGYHNLIVDMRSLIIMAETGYPVVMDATHSVQLPSSGKVSGGHPKFIKPLARAATAVGIDALFLEVHPDPRNALSDAASQLDLNELPELLQEVVSIDRLVKKKGIKVVQAEKH